MERVNPHQTLGFHDGVIRLFRPGAKETHIEVRGEIVSMQPCGDGIFEYKADISPFDYRIYHQSGLLAHDPYIFEPTIDIDTLALFSRGELLDAHLFFGGRKRKHQGVWGVSFVIWAPNAKSVALVFDHNHFDGRTSPMRCMGSSGVWELFVPGLDIGEKYKYEVRGQDDVMRLKADPFAYQGEMRPKTASCVQSVDAFCWSDWEWMERRREVTLDRPISIYEVHLGSWRKGEEEFSSYKEISHDLVEYCCQMGFTHIELLPVMGHPLDESWGYQVSGFYAISRRYGSIEEFQYFVDHAHTRGIGVILDWVPAHFPTDGHALSQFDGSHLYEHEDPRQGFHPHWNTLIFNYGRPEVASFLLGSALFYLDKMHIDGLRVDAVASMIYLDYGRAEGEWIPNKFGGKENLEALSFLERFNREITKRHPGVLKISEESTNYPGITKKIGFDMNWNLGWMNDTLSFLSTDFSGREGAFDAFVKTFSYCHNERSLLPLSHDEVVHRKKSLIDKMPGNEAQKFAGVRLLLSYLTCFPGKSLLFMGGEFGQWMEWDCKGEIHWPLLDLPYHKGLLRCVQRVNHLVKECQALHGDDFSPEGTLLHTAAYPVLAYWRVCGEERVLCIHNLGERESTLNVKSGHILFSSDAKEFCGSGLPNRWCGTIPPLTTIILEDVCE